MAHHRRMDIDESSSRCSRNAVSRASGRTVLRTPSDTVHDVDRTRGRLPRMAHMVQNTSYYIGNDHSELRNAARRVGTAPGHDTFSCRSGYRYCVVDRRPLFEDSESASPYSGKLGTTRQVPWPNHSRSMC